jgi:acyl-CoA thioester hydrolase
VLSDYRFVHPIEVRFGDMDAIGHINNAVYLSYLESARIAYWLHVTRRSGLKALDMILARTEIDYRSPAVYGEALDVGVRVESMRRSSFAMRFEVVEHKGRRLVAEARKVLVYYDYEAKASRPLPDAIRQQILAHDPEVRQE